MKKAAAIDTDNVLLWRMNRSRLEAEEVRDAVLEVSGKLNLTAGGPGFELFKFTDDKSPVYDHLDVASVNNPPTGAAPSIASSSAACPTRSSSPSIAPTQASIPRCAPRPSPRSRASR